MSKASFVDRIRFSMQWRLATLGNGLRDAVAYRVEFFLELAGSAFVPAAFQLVLWWALFEQAGVSEVGGRNRHELILYTIFSTLFTQIRGGNHDFEIQEMIRSGQLSQYLLRPVGVIEFFYLRGIVPRLITAGICFVVGIILTPLLGVGTWYEGLFRMSMGMSMALLGNVIHYQVGAALSATAFYWEEAYSVLMVKNMIVSLLSGELIPLTLFPAKYSWIWESTPFYIYVFGPTEIALGRWSASDFLRHFGIGLLWFFACWILIRLSWRIGMKRYSSLGG